VVRNTGLLLLPGLLPPLGGLGGPWLAAIVLLAALVPFQPIMAPQLRYLWPLSPVAFLTAGVGFARVWAWCAPLPRAWSGRAALALVPIGVIVRMGVLAPQVLEQQIEYASEVHAHLRLGDEVARLATADLRLATSDAGIVPYMTDAWTLDLAGLNNARVAR